MSGRLDSDLPAGAIDLHCHAGPSLWPRPLNSQQALEQATSAGMSAVVLKDHHRTTFMEARMLNEDARPGAARAIGSIVLNESQGGLNEAAVSTALELGARVVWMPTVSAQQHQQIAFESGAPTPLRESRRAADGGPLKVVASDGRLKGKVDRILRLIAEAGAVVATGHLSAAEALVVAKRAHQLGIKGIIATHPCLIVGASDADLRELAAAGALIEVCASLLLADSSLHCTNVEDVRHWANLVGINSLLLSSDLGQVGNPMPVEGLGLAVSLLRRSGFSDEEIRILVVESPHRVLGLEL
jgi:hypothetical protein